MTDLLPRAHARPRAPEVRRAALLMLCLVASLAVQAGAWRVAAAVLGRETAGGRAAGGGPVSLRIDAVAARAVEGVAGKTEAQPAAARPKPSKTPPPAVLARSREPDAGPVERGDDADLDRPRFYSYREVDVPAEPVLQWNLDPAALDALATSRIVFTLLVGSDGTVLHCSVDEPERLPVLARRSLEARLKETQMRPARRGGVAVASRRRVELFTEGGI